MLSKLVLGIFLISLINCEDSRTRLTEVIEKRVKSLNNPSGTNNLIASYDKKLVDVLFYTLDLNKIETVKVKFNLPDSLVNQITVAKYSRTPKMIKLESDLSKLSYDTYEIGFGGATREADGKISFILLKTRSKALIQKRYEKYYTKECHRVWLFFTECKNIEHTREKELTSSEKILINEAVKYSAYQLMLEGINYIKQNRFIINGVNISL